MRTRLAGLIVVLGTGLALAAQAPRFEVASVKPNLNPKALGPSYQVGGGFRGTLYLDWLVAIAYEVNAYQVIGGPSWGTTEYFDIDARSDGPATQAETNAMLRTLLAERFGLVARKDPNFKAKVWVLKMARDDRRLGPSIRRAELECIKTPENAPVSQRQMHPGVPVPCGGASNSVTIAGGGEPFSRLFLPIHLAVGEEVVDRTELTGLFDYYARIPRRSASGQQDPDDVSIFTAVQEELGMKLEREEVARPAVIIERASRPTPN